MNDPRNTLTHYRLGLPAWAFPGWRGRFFPGEPSPLANYASVFNAVEGNTTFYRTPDRDTVAKWRAAVSGRDFRFCFKLPKTVTHERSPDRVALRDFLLAVEPLGEHLGPLLVQLPAWIGPGELTFIETLFDALPADQGTVLEVRHPRFFSEPRLLEPLLSRYGCGRVMMDARPLYEGDREHPDVRSALHEKPDVPVLPTVYNELAFVRLVLHPGRQGNGRYVREWVRRCTEWLDAGYRVYMMIHCPNNLHCPEMAREFHEALRASLRPDAPGPLPPWPLPEQGRLI